MFREKTSFRNRVKEAIRPTPMGQRVNQCLFKLKVQQRKLERTSYHMQQRDQALYGKCVLATQSKNTQLASMYANECAELRKMAKLVLHSELALEQVTLRLETVHEFGNMAATMIPVANVVRTLKTQLEGVMPEVSLELAEVNDTLEDLAVQVGEATETSFDVTASSAESQQILQEANTVAEQKMKERFPELPAIATSPESRI
jgi:division protein CdvB (Snf7/Vps24/ESCRT-III family)